MRLIPFYLQRLNFQPVGVKIGSLLILLAQFSREAVDEFRKPLPDFRFHTLGKSGAIGRNAVLCLKKDFPTFQISPPKPDQCAGLLSLLPIGFDTFAKRLNRCAGCTKGTRSRIIDPDPRLPSPVSVDAGL